MAKLKRNTADANLSNVTVKIKQPEPVEIEVDIDRLKWEHSTMLSRAQSDDVPEAEQTELVFGVLEAVTGQDMRQMPLRVINAVLGEIRAHFGADPN
jgi:hypothetical protein